jgi:hypothetical protein
MEFDQLYEQIIKIKNDVLMEEPCPLYEPEWEDACEMPLFQRINMV